MSRMPDRQRRRYAPRLPREQRQQQLLDAAMTVLADCPLQELSMEAVAEAAGVGKPVLYTAFRTRAELVTALPAREHQRGLQQVRAAMRADLSAIEPSGAYPAAVSALVRCALENPTRWRLILTSPDSVPREYRDALHTARSDVEMQAQELAKAGTALDPRLAQLDPVLLGHTMLSFAEMLGRLAINEATPYPRERLEQFAMVAMTMFAGAG